MSFKVLGVGLPKTGTTTLCDALLSAGLQAIHQISGWRQAPAGVLMVQAWEEGLPLNHYTPFVEAVTQLDSSGKHHHVWPQFDRTFLQVFKNEFPEAVTVLHTRDPRKTVESMKRWGDFYERVKASAPGLSPSARDEDVIDWIESYYAATREFYNGDDKFISFDIEDATAREQLEHLLGRQIKWWGKANAWRPGRK